MSDSSDTPPAPEVIEQAAQWAALIDAGELSGEERQAFDEWCAADPLHHRTLDRMRAFDTRVAEDLDRDALAAVQKRRRNRRAGGTMLGIVAVAVAGWTGMQSDYFRDRFPDYQSGRGELRTVALEDGSEIVIDTSGAVDVDMARAERRVRLIRGQLLAQVAKDNGRPFTIETVDGTATALGTRFMVRREARYTLVTVLESRVRVCPREAQNGVACRILAPGERVRVTAAQLSAEIPVDPSTAALWSSGWLEADDRDVAEVLAELSRYSEHPIRFDAGSLRGVKVTGSFPLRDVDRAATGIAQSAALRVDRVPDGEIIFTRQR